MTRRLIHKIFHTLFVVLPMSGILTFVAVMKNFGWKKGWAYQFLESWLYLFPIGYLMAFLIIPTATFFVNKIFK
ncbi:DUF2798 domain-containing protein [Dysgonomonas capnocytophagoides]|uniref:DUF2798 domain-containing protein n=1 Tax=Dysgonomonas capnocytophagoides TaxID=45254 RepID=UPI0033425B89